MERINTQLMQQTLRCRQYQFRHPDVTIIYSGSGLGLYEARRQGHLVDVSSDLGALIDSLESADR